MPGRVIVRSGKVELGQGIQTAFVQIVADELDVDPARIVCAAADTFLGPDEGFTAGSLSVEVGGKALRIVSAEIRKRILHVASGSTGSAARLEIRDGTIVRDGEETRETIWSIALRIDWETAVDGGTPVKEFADRLVVGSSLPRMDLADKLTGAPFIHDLRLPGMVHARVVRPPHRDATLVAFDEDQFRQKNDDGLLFRRLNFLAVMAASEHEVERARLRAERIAVWSDDATPSHWQIDDFAPSPAIAGAAAEGPAGRSVTATYSRPFLAHASIGPSCAVAWADGEILRIWTHSQGIFPLREQIARVLGRDTHSVVVTHVQGAGCYGHNGADDAACEAAILACELNDVPIRVQWNRADELAIAPFGCAMTTTLSAQLSDSGTVDDWTCTVLSGAHSSRPGTGGSPQLVAAAALNPAWSTSRGHVPSPDADGGMRNARAIYDLPQRIERRFVPVMPVRTSALRSLGAHLNVFAIESFVDELAAAIGEEPVAFRLRMLTDTRARAVLAKADAMAGLSERLRRDTEAGFGIAVARYKNAGAYLAAAVEVELEEEIRVKRIWCSVDAGALINPDGARNQIEGGAIQATSFTLKEQVLIQGSRILSTSFETYPILRFSDAPEIEVTFIEEPSAAPLGVGEAAIGPVAAAIANAASRALGQRLRSMPLTRGKIIETLEQV